MRRRSPNASMTPMSFEQERELLFVADELDEVWDSFVSGDGPGVIPVSMCREWRDRILRALDGDKSQAISGNVGE